MTLTRWMAVSDTHGDMIDAEAWGYAREFAEGFKPTVRLHLGDAFDLRFLRSGASDEEKQADVMTDFEMGCNLLDEYKPTHFLFGNHDQRLVRACTNGSGMVRAFAREWHDVLLKQLRALRCEVYPYNIRSGVVEAVGLRFAHGYSHGQYASRQHAIAYGDVLTGHVHRIDSMTASRLQGDGSTVARGRCIGCLCRLDMEYAQYRLATMQWQHGFVFGTYDTKTGAVTVCQAERNQATGEWSVPILTDWRKPLKSSTSRRSKKVKKAGTRRGR